METLIINLIGGAVGGNIFGAILKNLSLGTVGNSIAGIVGGAIASQLAPDLLGTSASMDLTGILSQIASGGAGGGIVMIVVGLIKNMLGR